MGRKLAPDVLNRVIIHFEASEMVCLRFSQMLILPPRRAFVHDSAARVNFACDYMDYRVNFKSGSGTCNRWFILISLTLSNGSKGCILCW